MVERLGNIVGKVGLVMGVVVLLGVAPTQAADAGMRYRLQLSYFDGFSDLVDLYEDNAVYDALGSGYDYDGDTFEWPVGISFYPYYQWENGLLVGGGLGPFMYVMVEVDDYWGDSDDSYTHWQLPLSAYVGYRFGSDWPVSPYVRGGPSYHLADGDFYDKSNVGVVGAVGLEFLKSDHVSLGVEAACDTASVEIENHRTGGNKKIKAAEFSIGLFFQFK